ncbi:ATPase-AAA-core domain-containing protein [Favolaschia claudopus]|uniref:ATPase-AAA-core domain-containing protein n=1 Tax=Favolaschia claudopus TaxID=2862362 RepID=A0AAV9ZC06_9AGAR
MKGCETQIALTKDQIQKYPLAKYFPAKLLSALHDSFSPPFINTLSSTTTALADALQNVKRNQDDCAKLVEHIPTLLTAIVGLHMKAEPVGIISAAMLFSLGHFTETLAKIYTYDAHSTHFFRQGDINTLLKTCYAGLEQAKATFRYTILQECQRPGMFYKKTTKQHQTLKTFGCTKPTTFHGREIEVASILELLQLPSPRIAILGAGGMGKTSLARVALHEEEVTARYETRIFVSCDATSNGIDIANIIGLQLGLKPGKDIRKLVVQFLKEGPACLLILDNLETPWEPPNLETITMRGAERPNQIPWSRPFLLPLKPLSDEAAQQTFTDITDYAFDPKEIVQLLYHTDNMPLAVNLFAHLVDYEGITSVLNRWETEKTSLLSVNTDRTSSLDVSIFISLSSPRVVLSDAQLLQSNLPIPDLLKCKTTLLRTALAYYDEGRHLKSLVPIREYVQQNHPPSLVLVAPLQDYIHSQLRTDQMLEIHKVLTANSGNIQSDTIECTISFCHYERSIFHARPALMDTVSSLLFNIKNPKLHVQFITEEFRSSISHPVFQPQHLLDQAITCLKECDDSVLESNFYQSAGYFYNHHQNNIPLSIELYEKSLAAAQICGDTILQSKALHGIALTYWRIAHKLARLTGNLYHEAGALCADAMCSQQLGDYNIAVKLFYRARDCLAQCGITGGRSNADVMIDLADLHLSKSEYSEAYQIHTNMVQDAALVIDKDTYGCCLLNIAQIDVIIGTPVHEIQPKINELKRIFMTLQDRRAGEATEMVSADLSLRECNHVHAESVFTTYFHMLFGDSAEHALHAIERLADHEQWGIQYFDTTFIWAMIYLSYASGLKNKLALHKALACIGQIYLAQHDLATAHNLFTVALEGFVRMGVHHSRGRCLLYLGNIAEQEGRFGKAAELWTGARPLFEKSLQAKDVEKIDAKLARLAKEQVFTSM